MTQENKILIAKHSKEVFYPENLDKFQKISKNLCSFIEISILLKRKRKKLHNGQQYRMIFYVNSN